MVHPKDLIELTKWTIEGYKVFEGLSVRLEEIQETTKDHQACGWAILGYLRRVKVAENSEKKEQGRSRAFDETQMVHMLLSTI